MGITNSNKQINVSAIDCQGTLQVTLALSAAPDISENPTDIVLVLDRSNSMAGTPLANMKLGADTFIDIIAETTGGGQSGQIGGGSRMAVVSFATTASVNEPLITSVSDLKAAVNSLSAGGSTNHGDAFALALSLFPPASTNAKVIVMFTDGKTTVGPPPAPIAAAAKAAGVIIYCIGLIGADGVDVATLDEWASPPAASHVAVTPDAADLEALFADLAKNISKPGATGIVIDETINPDFVIIGVTPPSVGTATTLSNTTLRWNIPELGVSGSEGASLEFRIRHISQTAGVKYVNQAITYTDNEGNVVTFPDPSVRVDCNAVITPEPCPNPVNVTIEGCQDSLTVDLGETELQSLGRILQLDVTIPNVCPHRRVALAVILTEVDGNGQEHPRGIKTITVPAHTAGGCRDVQVACIRFVLPEDLDVSGGSPNSICNPRDFRVRFLANYIDTDFTCCGEATV